MKNKSNGISKQGIGVRTQIIVVKTMEHLSRVFNSLWSCFDYDKKYDIYVYLVKSLMICETSAAFVFQYLHRQNYSFRKYCPVSLVMGY